MEQYRMTANFYPAKEPKNGYIGFADLTIADAIRLRGISVFEKADGSGHNIHFPGFGDEDNSFVVPDSKEAYAQMVNVIGAAVKDEANHFGWQTGKVNPRLTVKGHAVDQAYADGRYSIQVADICRLRGVATREVPYTKDGKDASFVSVDVPTLTPYDKDGEKVYPAVFEGLECKYQKDGEEKKKDFGLLMRNLVLAERKNIREQHPKLEDQIKNAEQRSNNHAPAQDAPQKEASR